MLNITFVTHPEDTIISENQSFAFCDHHLCFKERTKYVGTPFKPRFPNGVSYSISNVDRTYEGFAPRVSALWRYYRTLNVQLFSFSHSHFEIFLHKLTSLIAEECKVLMAGLG